MLKYTLTLLVAASTIAFAQNTVTTQNVSLAAANTIAMQAVAECQAKGYLVSATVVDRSGLVVAVARADGAGPHTIEASKAKAFTSVSARNLTSAVLENVQKNAAAQYLPDIPGFLVLAGGVPIRAGNEVIGAVGVGGAPGGHLDEQCAVAAIAKVFGQ
ncbi:GlcG/HbpS family heme-binding protein [Deinococcus cellulosilyticus]|uniref:Heme-binding protein n=1 Tax=Deinococcus cellulosilyticus (strain DSM 18568 / NBRC 106333 / KACC 11606 / 5516J-15) TaxID=1223518 RepID=A0A511N2D2_DEIC1|nr:heme-binding protein [Deinococcus cellulosilyticus]GEM47014.1 hypothetical protein DC3_26490 [Deinococcus cellulosilyticus NBRC 106333 = KACC 11606]